MNKNANVLFINLPSPDLLIPKWSIPNSILYLMSYLESKDICSDLLDMGDYLLNDVEKIPLNYDYFCISCYTMQHDMLRIVSSYIKEHSNATVIVGGRHATYLSKEILEDMAVDVVVRGEGEETLYEVVSGVGFDGILGITFKKNGEIYFNNDRPLIADLNLLPYPKFDCLNLDEYPGNCIREKHSKYRVGVMFSRGCYGRCEFCTSVDFWRGSVRFYEFEWIKKYIDYLLTYQIHDIHINDDNFLIHKDFERICTLLKEHNIRYQCLGTSVNVNEKKAKLLFETGCYKVSLGIESGSDHLLRLMKKSANATQNEQAINILKEAGLFVESFLIIGFPGETKNDIDATIDFIRKSRSDIFSISTFVPFPGCGVWNNREKYGIKLDNNYSKYLHLGKELNIPSVVANNEKLNEYRELLHKALREKDIIFTKVVHGKS